MTKRPPDHDKIHVTVSAVKGRLVIRFGTSITWLSIEPEDALELAASIKRNAETAIASRRLS